MVFLLILDVLGNFVHFIGFMVFWSFKRFEGYFSNLISFWGIFVILEVLGVLSSFLRFQGYVVLLRDFECILAKV